MLKPRGYNQGGYIQSLRQVDMTHTPILRELLLEGEKEKIKHIPQSVKDILSIYLTSYKPGKTTYVQCDLTYFLPVTFIPCRGYTNQSESRMEASLSPSNIKTMTCFRLPYKQILKYLGISLFHIGNTVGQTLLFRIRNYEGQKYVFFATLTTL
jgi:hypothetical protein